MQGALKRGTGLWTQVIPCHSLTSIRQILSSGQQDASRVGTM